jgi:hypothetical protein
MSMLSNVSNIWNIQQIAIVLSKCSYSMISIMLSFSHLFTLLGDPNINDYLLIFQSLRRHQPLPANMDANFQTVMVLLYVLALAVNGPPLFVILEINPDTHY